MRSGCLNNNACGLQKLWMCSNSVFFERCLLFLGKTAHLSRGLLLHGFSAEVRTTTWENSIKQKMRTHVRCFFPRENGSIFRNYSWQNDNFYIICESLLDPLNGAGATDWDNDSDKGGNQRDRGTRYALLFIPEKTPTAKDACSLL